MTSRERIQKTIHFEEPDRVPIDLGGSTGASGIHVVAYDVLRKHLGLPHGKVKSNDVMQQLAVIDEEIRQRLHLDVAQISTVSFARAWHDYPFFPSTTVSLPLRLNLVREKDEWLLTDGDGHRYRKPDSSLYFDSEDGLHWHATDLPLSDEFLADFQKKVRAYHQTTEYALAGRFGGGFFSTNPQFLMDLITEPQKVHDILDQKCDDLIARYTRLNEAIGDCVFCAIFADDFGAQKGPLIGPDLFHEMIVPHYQKFTRWLHTHTSMKLYLHSCGAIMPLMDDIVDMGVDILNPVQTSAQGMDPKTLKARYGKKIVFWGGGCDTQNVLGKKTSEEMVEHVKERLKIFAPGGGFVFNQVHAIQPTVKPGDVCAMFDAVRRYGTYPIPSESS